MNPFYLDLELRISELFFTIMQKQDIRKMPEATRVLWACQNHHVKFLYLYKIMSKSAQCKSDFHSFCKQV